MVADERTVRLLLHFMDTSLWQHTLFSAARVAVPDDVKWALTGGARVGERSVPT
jgi:hypothetical protein